MNRSCSWLRLKIISFENETRVVHSQVKETCQYFYTEKMSNDCCRLRGTFRGLFSSLFPDIYEQEH